jgi:hypothetical protein
VEVSEVASGLHVVLLCRGRAGARRIGAAAVLGQRPLGGRGPRSSGSVAPGLVHTESIIHSLDDAPQAYRDLRDGKVNGRAVMAP